MAKFTQYQQPRKERPWKIHPVWRGIGCLMLILIPLMSYAGASLLMEANMINHWVPVPREFRGPAQYPYLFARLGVTLLISVLGFVVLIILYSLVYRFAGVSRYGPQDAPPSRKSSKRRRR
ncbi:MAG: hypothetical protein KKD28_09745 [Chloroflexi bacterium]|nr:hypothetical protein [Chloroflexota bacterium]